MIPKIGYDEKDKIFVLYDPYHAMPVEIAFDEIELFYIIGLFV